MAFVYFCEAQLVGDAAMAINAINYLERHPEITKLRFDRERSNPEDMPMNIREPLLSILAEYADGMVLREGTRWIDISRDHPVIRNKTYKLELK